MNDGKCLKVMNRYSVSTLFDYIIKKRKVIIILIALFVTITMNIILDINSINLEGGFVKKILTMAKTSLKDIDGLQSLLVFIGLNFLFSKTLLREKNHNKGKEIYKIILPIIFSVIVLISKSYQNYNSWDMIFYSKFQFVKAFLVGIGYYLIFKSVINYLFDDLLEKIKYSKSKNKLFNCIFEKHSFIVPVLIILICWMPYIIIYFPGTIMQDSRNQIFQFFGYEIGEFTMTNSVNLIDENVKITNHHPVLHTVLLGICMKFGKLVGNDNVGVFMCSLMQILLLVTSFGAILNFMKETKTKNCIRVITLLGFSMLPIFPVFALYITKDMPFTAFFIFYIIQFYWLVKKGSIENIPIRKIFSIIVISLGMCFFNHKGIYIILLSLPLLIIADKLNRKKIIIMLVIIFVTYKSFTSILLPALKIAPTSVREMLSIPFQQTARYVREHEEDVTEYERKIIDKILGYETLSERYDPNNADNVKNKYNKNATEEDLKSYFKVWIEQFFKHPTTYIQATLNNCYSYFWPDATANAITTKFTVNSNKAINNGGHFNYHYISEFEPMRSNIKDLLKAIPKVPVISWSVNSGISVWAILTMFTYIFYNRKYKYIIAFMPIVSIVLMGLASPVLIYRYTIPYIWAMPLIISMFLDIIKKEEKFCNERIK